MSFKDTNQYKKGDIGEKIVRNYLQKAGWFVYSLLDDPDRPHPIDTVAMKTDTLMLMDVKTYPRRQNHSDTGIDQHHRLRYIDLSRRHNLKVFLAFCDEIEQRIYGHWLHVLERHRPAGTVHGSWFNGRKETNPWDYPQFWQKKVYYPLSVMEHITDLTHEQVQKIGMYTTRNAAYTYS